MSWILHDGSTKLKVEVGSKVKTQLTPFKCAIGDTVENDNITLFKKIWIVEEVNTSFIILKSGKEIMRTSLNGFSLGDWIHHRVYKVKI